MRQEEALDRTIGTIDVPGVGKRHRSIDPSFFNQNSRRIKRDLTENREHHKSSRRVKRENKTFVSLEVGSGHPSVLRQTGGQDRIKEYKKET